MRSLLTVIFLTAGFVSMNAQRTSAGLSLQLSFPQGVYKSTYPKTGVGIRFNVLRRISEEGPISVGGEIGYLVTGSDSKRFDGYYSGYYDRYKISASNNIVSFAFNARADLVSREKPVLIFVQATIGANLFYSSATIEGESYFGGSSQIIDSDSSPAYWAFTWGPGVGIEIPLDKRRQIAVMAKGSYLLGTKTTYLANPYIDNNGNIYFTQHESKTDMVLAELGVRFTFYKNRNRRR